MAKKRSCPPPPDLYKRPPPPPATPAKKALGESGIASMTTEGVKMQRNKQRLWQRFGGEGGRAAVKYADECTVKLQSRIAELEAALEQEHRESWATDLPYEPHPLLAKEPA